MVVFVMMVPNKNGKYLYNVYIVLFVFIYISSTL